jgi:FSR family fosmidomycin resistance protein-like MFS transporter
LGVLWLGHFFVDLMIGIWPVYKTIAHIDLAIAGLIGGFCAFAGEGLQVLFGSLSDKGYRKALVLGGVAAATASAYLVYADDYLYLFILYLVTCLGSSAFHPAAVGAIGDLEARKRGLILGLFTSGGALGMAFSQIIFMQTHSWFEGQVAWLALPALLLAFFASFGRLSETAHTRDSGHSFSIKAFSRFFHHQELRMLYICQVCNATMLWGTMFLLPDILASRGFEPWISYGGGHMMFILGGAVMMIPAGYLADCYSSRIVLLVSIVFSTILLYIFLLNPLVGNYTLLLILFAMGAAFGANSPVALILGAHLVPSQKGLVAAFSMGLVWCISEGIGQGCGGFLATCFDTDGPAKALSVLGSVLLAGTAAAYFLPKKEEAIAALERSRQAVE